MAGAESTRGTMSRTSNLHVMETYEGSGWWGVYTANPNDPTGDRMRLSGTFNKKSEAEDGLRKIERIEAINVNEEGR